MGDVGKNHEASLKRTTLVGHRPPGNHIAKLAPYMGTSRRFDLDFTKKGSTRTINRKLRRRDRDKRQDSSSAMSNGSSSGSTSLDELEGERAPSLSSLSFKSRREIRGGSRVEDRSVGSLSYHQKVLDNLNTSKFEEASEYHETGYPLAARGLLQNDLQTTSKAINLSGGVQVNYQSVVSVVMPHLKSKSTMGETLHRFRKKNTKKIVVLQYGKFRVFTLPRNGSGIQTGTNMLTENDLDECKLEEDFLVSNLRSIRYNHRDSNMFTLVYWKRRHLPTADGDYHEVREMQFRTTTGIEAEDWIRLFLLEARNQALVFDSYAKVLRKERKNFEAINSFLRFSVDLWSLALGKGHPETKDAQLRLSDWLIAHKQEEEGRYWEEYAIRGEGKPRLSPLDELKAEISDDEFVTVLMKKIKEAKSTL